MPVFEVQAPDGKTYEVDAPDMQSAVSVFRQPELSADTQTPNIGAKGDMRAGTRFQPDLSSTTMQGMTLNFGDEIVAGASAPFHAAKNLFTGEGPTSIGENYDQGLAFQRAKTEATREQRPGAALATEIGGALATAKLPLGLISKAKGLGSAALRSAGAGAGIGGIAGFGGGEGGLEDRLEGAGTGAFIGSAAGAAAPYVAAGLGKLISPFRTSDARTQMADYLRRQGVDLTAGQKTGSNALRYAESEIGGQKAANIAERQGEQFTSAALKRAGINATRATPDVVDDGFARIGKQFDDLAARNTLEPDQKMMSDLQGVVQDYASLVPKTFRAPVIQNVVDDIVKTASLRGPNGTNALQGSSYQAQRSKLDRAARGTNEPQLAQALRGIKDVLDEAMERSIAKNNPADAGAWRQARQQYRNMLVIEKAATGAGESAALGLISPSHLRNATVQQGRRGYARGKGDFAQLARAGEAIMKPMPQSGTAPRLASRLPAILGGIGGTMAGGLDAGLLAAGGAMIAPKLAGRALMSRPGQAYLGNQVVSPEMRALVNALLVSGSVPAGRRVAP